MDRLMSDTKDRVAGVLMGLAAGDQIGGPIRMAVRVGESLLERRTFDPADIMGRYLHWWRNGAFDTGPTVASVLTRVDRGVPYTEVAGDVHEETGGMTAGCNPAHRSAPLAMCSAIRDVDLAAAATAEAQLTHWHPLAGEVAAAVVRLCRSLVRGLSWPEALRAAAADRSPEIRRVLESAAEAPTSRSGFAPDALRAAVHFVRVSSSFDEALERALEFAGPANYSPVLVGSIAGARWGSTAVDTAFVAHHGEFLSHVAEVASALASGWSRSA
jgi:ADP-ribosylglycohydrolase